ncbi:MAG: nuclear transport factor 2 family protein [Deltaproteobacteria bacterium]|nr:nuclear transport factor 2 family protein [Deltaproteobacteria bacterium]MBW2359656.1 nuclear transport factor 2 family protein [Deltaproteobacteria bacterium]
MPDPSLDDVIAKSAIRDVLSRYCRGLDRMDKDMAYATWHEDGTAHYIDIFEGTGRGFVDWVWQAHEPMECHSHQITNTLIEVDGERATSESYVTVLLWMYADESGERTEIVGRGRYLDRWSRRNGRWAIDHRTHVSDAQTFSVLGKEQQTPPQGSRDESDPSFQFIPKY